MAETAFAETIFRGHPTLDVIQLQQQLRWQRLQTSECLRHDRALIKEDDEMKRLLSATVGIGLLAWFTPVAQAQTPGEVVRKGAPSVVVIRAKGRDISAGGQSLF